MLLIVIFILTFFLNAVTASQADTSHCAQIPELTAAHVRWAAARQSRVEPAHKDKSCRSYQILFYEAVTARHAVSLCASSSTYERELRLLDSEIDAFNNIIAGECGS